MKIAILIPRLTGGGAEDVARKWFVALKSRGHNVQFVLTHDSMPPPSLNSEAVSLASASGFISKTMAFRKRIQAENYSAIISLMPYCNLLSLISSAGLKSSKPMVVISEHTIHAELNKTDRISHQIQWRMARWFYRYAAASVAVSHAVAAEMASSCHVPSARLWIVPNPAAEGIEIRSFRPAVSGPHETSVGTLALVVPSRLVRQKRVEVALETARIVAQETNRQVRVEFFGEGPEKEHLQELAARYNIPCFFPGWVHKWYDHIPEDGIVLLPSGTEGFGNVLVEAASRSVPCVVSSKALGVADACIPEVTAKLVAGDLPSDYAHGVIAASQMALPDVSQWLARFTNSAVADFLALVLSRSINHPDSKMGELDGKLSESALASTCKLAVTSSHEGTKH